MAFSLTSLVTEALVGKLLQSVVDVVNKRTDKQISANEIRGELGEAFTATVGEVADASASVLIAEAQGEGWLQRSWRPLTGLSFAFVVFFYAVITPAGSAWFGLPPPRIGDSLLMEIIRSLVIFGSVYAGGRSAEKIVKSVVERIR